MILEKNKLLNATAVQEKSFVLKVCIQKCVKSLVNNLTNIQIKKRKVLYSDLKSDTYFINDSNLGHRLKSKFITIRKYKF